MALEIPVIGQDFGGRETHGDGAQRVRLAVEEHHRKADAQVAKRAAKLQVRFVGLELDHVVPPVRNQRADLFDHLQDERVLAAPEADYHRFRVLAQKREYPSLETPHYGRRCR